MNPRRHAALALAWTLVGAVILSADGPGEVRVTPIVADGRIHASFTAPNAFTEDAQAVLQSGLLLTFTFTVDLRKPSGFWWDHTVASVPVGATGKFDNLTGSYLVSKMQDGHVAWSNRTMNATEARGWMTAFDRVPLVAADRLEPNAEYYIHVRLRATPKRTFSLWPWSEDDAAGRAVFTNIR